MTQASQTFRDILEGVGTADTQQRVATRQAASVVYAPRRKQIAARTVYQVLVDGVATTGSGFSTEGWRTKADANLSALRKQNALNATWGVLAPVVTVQATSKPVDTIKEWANSEISLYRQYRRNSIGRYDYIGVTQ